MDIKQVLEAILVPLSPVVLPENCLLCDLKTKFYNLGSIVGFDDFEEFLARLLRDDDGGNDVDDVDNKLSEG